jgi:hypothetical protein
MGREDTHHELASKVELVPGPNPDHPEEGAVYRVEIPAEGLDGKWFEMSRSAAAVCRIRDTFREEIAGPLGLTADLTGESPFFRAGQINFFLGGFFALRALGMELDPTVIMQQLARKGN